jgi:hypothetical protein
MAKDLQIKVTATDGASKTFQTIGASANQMGDKIDGAAKDAAESLKRLSTGAKVAGVAIGAAIGYSVKSASDLNESMDKAARTFGKDFSEIEGFAAHAAKSMGLSKQEALDAASAFGLMFQSAGESGAQLTDMSEATTQLAADLGSLYNVGSQEAQQALISGLVGESEPLRQFNIFLSETAVNAELAREGIQAVGGQFTEQQKVIARYNLIMQQGQTATGNFVETSDGLANSMKTAHAEIENAASALGAAFLPAAIQAAHGITTVAEAISSLPQGVQTGIADAILGVGGIALLGIGALKVVELTQDLKALAAAAQATRVGSLAITALTNPYVLAAGAITAAGIALYEYSSRESSAEKATKALRGATDEYTASIVANTTALVNAGAYDQVKQTEDYLNIWINNGKIAADRIAELAANKDRLDQDAALGGTREVPVWQAMVDGGFITEYTAQVLAANDANADGRISSEEYMAAQVDLHKGFELTTAQAAKLTSELNAVDIAASNPDLYGAAMAKEADKIIRDLTTGVIGYDEAASLLAKLPTDEKYNIALAEHNELTAEATDNVTARAVAEFNLQEALYGGTAALAANKDLAEASVKAGTAYSASLNSNAIAGREASAVANDYTDQLIELAAAYNGIDAAKNAYDMVVGFTDGMVQSIATSKKWSDSISGALGTDFMENGDASAVLNLLNQKKIDTEDYNEVLKAQKTIYEDNARAQEASQIIQIKQADVIAAGTTATADYLVALSQQDELQQQISLAYADPAEAQHIQNITDMAAGYNDMSAAGKEAFEQTVTSAAALDPALAAVLEDLGIIEATTENSSGWKLTTDTTESQSAMDTLVSTIQGLIDTLSAIYNLQVTTTFDDTSFWQVYNGLPNSKAINVYTVSGSYGPTADAGAIGGVHPAYAAGGVVHLAELGPEMLRFRSGAIGMAYNEGNYMIPDGTHVQTAASTAHQLGNGRANRGITITGPVYITPTTADLHDAISSSVLRGGI